MDLVDLLRANVRHSRQLAKEILADPSTVILDTETTGLSSGARIVDLAVIQRGATLYNTLIDPEMHIPADASAIHGIYDRDVKGAPTFYEVWRSGFREVLTRRRVVIYNAPYDLGVITGEVLRIGEKNSFRVQAEDALRLYQDWYFGGVGRSGRGQTKLTTPHCDSPACLAAVSKHSSAGAHRAFADCLATVERLRMIANTCWLEDHYRKATK